MKNYIFFAAFMLSCVFAFSQQVPSNFGGALNIYSTSGSAPNWTVEGFYNDPIGLYASDSVEVGDVIYAYEGATCIRFVITSIIDDTGSVIEAVVYDADTIATVAPSGLVPIMRETPNQMYPIYLVSGLSPDLFSCVETYRTILLDNLSENTDSSILAAKDTFYYSTGDFVVNGDTLISPFDSGDVFYVSTNGDDATGRKGYMELPFLMIPKDSLQAGDAIWYYPGNYVETQSAMRMPKYFYAENSTIEFSGLGNNFAFGLNTPGKDTIVFFNATSIVLSNSKLLRTGTPDNEEKPYIHIGQLTHSNLAGPYDAIVIDNGYIEIDSAYTEGPLFFMQPGTIGGSTQINITSLNASNPNDVLFSLSGSGNQTFTKISVGQLNQQNGERVYANGYGTRTLDNSMEKFILEQINIADNLPVIDTVPSIALTSGAIGSATQRMFFTYESLANSGSSFSLSLGDGVSDRAIGINLPGTGETYNFELGKTAFLKTRAIQFDNFSGKNLTGNVNAENCVSSTTPISILDSGGNFNISGKYECERAGSPVIYTQSDITIENAQLINDGIVPAIQAPSPITVYVRGDLYMNSDSINSNVTFQKIEYGYLNPSTGTFDDTQTILNSLGSDNIYGVDGTLAGPRVLDGDDNPLLFDTLGLTRFRGENSAEFLAQFSPLNSLPTLLRQMVGTDTSELELQASLGRAVLHGTQATILKGDSVYLANYPGPDGRVAKVNSTGAIIPDSLTAAEVVFDTTGNNVAATNVQDAISESNPTYNNHVWISASGGDNATGRLGDPHRAFADPWTAQDSLSETNLSFLAYQGGYEYSGPYGVSGEVLTRADTFLFRGLPGSYVGQTSVSGGGLLARFISDRTGPGNASEAKYIYIDSPQSDFYQQSTGTNVFSGVYNENSQLFFKVKNLKLTSGRTLGFYNGAKKSIVEIDSFYLGGGIAINIYDDASNTTPNRTVYNRKHEYKIGYMSAGAESSTDLNGLIRYQPSFSSGFKDSLSNYQIDLGEVVSVNPGLFLIDWNIPNSKIEKTTIRLNCAKFYQAAGTLNTAMIYLLGDTGTGDSLIESSVKINVDEVNTNGRLVYLGGSAGSDRIKMENSQININLGSAKSSYTTGSLVVFNDITLNNQSVVRIHCDYCYTDENVGFFDIDTNPVVSADSKIIISGTYVAPNRAGPLVEFNASIPDSCLIFENAVFINNGVSEWIRAAGAKTITGASGLWSNSDSTVNITIEGNELWGFQYPANNNSYSLQIILDSIFLSIPKHSATLYQSTLRQYTFPTPATVDTITIDTLSNALLTGSITQDTGYIRNISSDTMRWQVSYSFFRDSDEDALTSFIDLTTDGTDSPEAIPGSRAYSKQPVAAGTQHAGPTFTVEVPPGAALRLCVYGSSVAAGVDISDLTISVEEIYRE